MWILLVMSVATMISTSADSWRSVNDGVMGGISSGGMVQSADGMSFQGSLSLENNGGFSSVRYLLTEDFSDSTGIRITVKGDGRDYQFRIRQDERFDGISWRQEFSTDGSVQILELNYSDFTPVWRGREVRDAGDIIPEKVRQIGFLIADKQPGEFSLSILEIELLR
jgi:monofunctional biosynthetic peptidoglycan transglycosylase